MQYDTAFQRQVALSKDLHWGKINPTLYSICFAGHARCLARCTICLSTKLYISSQQLKTSPKVTYTTARLHYNGHNHNHHGHHFVKGLQRWRYACCTIAVKGQGSHLLTASMLTFASIAEEHTQLESAKGDTSLDQDRVQRRAASWIGWRITGFSEQVYCHRLR